MRERPSTLKPEYYDYLAIRLPELSDADLRGLLKEYGYYAPEEADRAELEDVIFDEPAAFLYHEYHLLEKPTALAGTIVTFYDGQDDEDMDYLIDDEAAEAIALPEETVTLRQIDTGVDVPTPIERIHDAFRNHCLIRYQEEEAAK